MRLAWLFCLTTQATSSCGFMRWAGCTVAAMGCATEAPAAGVATEVAGAGVAAAAGPAGDGADCVAPTWLPTAEPLSHAAATTRKRGYFMDPSGNTGKWPASRPGRSQRFPV